ncbi:MAG: cupin domain-containing protein [Hyphomonadaceae bacterium]|nr:cupin domain-containing protein [Hyphomonadaceae bacterium]
MNHDQKDIGDGRCCGDRNTRGNLRVRASSQAQDALAGSLMRREVQRAPLSIRNAKSFKVLTEIPSGVASGWHVHPGEKSATFSPATSEMRVEGRTTRVLQAGDGFIIPPNTPHNARDLGPETGRMLSAYIVQSGRPLSTFVTVREN